MGNKVVIFPVERETEARAYADWTDLNSPFEPGPGAWAYVRNDVFSQWVVPYLGPPFTWDGVEFPEPAGGEVMRVDGVLHDTAVWPPEEE